MHADSDQSPDLSNTPSAGHHLCGVLGRLYINGIAYRLLTAAILPISRPSETATSYTFSWVFPFLSDHPLMICIRSKMLHPGHVTNRPIKRVSPFWCSIKIAAHRHPIAIAGIGKIGSLNILFHNVPARENTYAHPCSSRGINLFTFHCIPDSFAGILRGPNCSQARS